MYFESIANNIDHEYEERLTLTNKLLTWGVSYLDDALEGIFANDLVLLGAPSGAGKTQLCVNIALKNIADGKRVHYIALEAHNYEVERRVAYIEFASRYFGNGGPRVDGRMNYKTWALGKHRKQVLEIEKEANNFCKKAYGSFFTAYKDKKFGVKELISHVNYAAINTDLIIVDHVHYFDWDDQNDNRAIKEIVHTARDLAQNIGKPIILVAHLRKRDRGRVELVSGLDEFHGSSELTKVPTKCITIEPGGVTPDGKYITYFRATKDRLDSGPNRYIGRAIFDPRKGSYENSYTVGWSNTEKFGELDHGLYPDWAKKPLLIKGAVNGRNVRNLAPE